MTNHHRITRALIAASCTAGMLPTSTISAHAAPADTNAAMQTVALEPVNVIDVPQAASARGLELDANGNLLMNSVGDNHHTSTLYRISTNNADSAEKTQLRTFTTPVNTADPMQVMMDKSTDELDNVAKRAAELAMEQYTRENGSSLKEGTDDKARDAYAATFKLDQLRYALGFGFTQLHEQGNNDDGSKPVATRTDQALWQLGNGNSIVLADGTATDNDVAITGRLDTMENSVGMCAMGVLNPDEPPITVDTVDDTHFDTTTSTVLTSSGSGAIVTRNPGNLTEEAVIQATLTHGLDGQTASEVGQRQLLMGLGELDCTSHAHPDDPISGAGIFAAIDRDLAARAVDHRNAADALDAHLGNDAQDKDDATNLRPTDTAIPVVPEQPGLVAVIAGSGEVRALLNSDRVAEAYPDVAGHDIATVAVDPTTYDNAKTTTAPLPVWKRILPTFVRNWFSDSDDTTADQTVNMWVTYKDLPNIYHVNAHINAKDTN